MGFITVITKGGYVKNKTIELLYINLDENTKRFVDASIKAITSAKLAGRKVMVATGSGPNIHEGVTTLIAELVYKGVVDGITTSSAVVSHELGGVLDRVKRIPYEIIKNNIKLAENFLPKGGFFEYTILTEEQINEIRNEMFLDEQLIHLMTGTDGNIIIKAAGNLAYPIGLRTEMLAKEILYIAKTLNKSFEEVAGHSADSMTMLGACQKMGVPILVSIPQLVGGGAVGICIAESIPISHRCAEIAKMIESSDVIIESAIALTQEIHDGPFETYTGHGIWAAWQGYDTYSLKEKTIIRIDLDENLYKAWDMERKSKIFQDAIDRSLPKTKVSNIPFRMEMSAFMRHEKSIPIVNDIGVIWPIIAYYVSNNLNINLNFISYPQQSEQGKEMREYIVKNIKYADRAKLKAKNMKFSE